MKASCCKKSDLSEDEMFDLAVFKLKIWKIVSDYNEMLSTLAGDQLKFILKSNISHRNRTINSISKLIDKCHDQAKLDKLLDDANIVYGKLKDVVFPSITSVTTD